ncbi:MAG: alpha-amylase family glycosyl hydrolase [Roseiflexaceae bacterium]|nr:alpha-amylase family glycosyl hydrolase [Roseiflexaceae bacterium]
MRFHRLLLLTLLSVLAACSTAAPPTAAPTSALAAPSPVVAPSPTSLSSEDALMATIAAGTTPTATASIVAPTAIPTITLGPTAVAKPLAEGWWDSAVCYEVFIRSFSDSDGNGIGDINGLIQRLDYINDGDSATKKDLGAPCIWLMPVAQAASYHGYDTTDYNTVSKDYGTNEDFKRLIAEAHKRGISVIIDLVLNHVSIQHPWFQDALNNPNSPYHDWFIWSPIDPGYRGPWGQQVWYRAPGRNEYYYAIFWEGMPDLNYRNPAVTAEAEKISAFWLNEMGVAGFRLDAIKHVVENGNEQENTRETHAWIREYASFLHTTKSDVFTVGEIFGGRPGVLDDYYPDQLDTYFEFAIGEGILNAARSGDARDFLRPAAAAYDRLPYQRYAPFLTNHDQERAMTTLGGEAGRARIAAVALLTIPGLPFIYYGEEIGMTGTQPDERLRTPMQWSNEKGGGFTTGQAWEGFQSDLAAVNVALQDDDPNSLLNLYRTLIQLHTSIPALAHGSFTTIETMGAPSVAAFIRRSGDSMVVVVLNFGTQPVDGATISAVASDLEPGTYRLTALLGDAQSADLVVGPGGAIANSAPLLRLAPQTGYIFRLNS